MVSNDGGDLERPGIPCHQPAKASDIDHQGRGNRGRPLRPDTSLNSSDHTDADRANDADGVQCVSVMVVKRKDVEEDGQSTDGSCAGTASRKSSIDSVLSTTGGCGSESHATAAAVASAPAPTTGGMASTPEDSPTPATSTASTPPILPTVTESAEESPLAVASNPQQVASATGKRQQINTTFSQSANSGLRNSTLHGKNGSAVGTNNNSLSAKEISSAEMELLKKLEEQNR